MNRMILSVVAVSAVATALFAQTPGQGGRGQGAGRGQGGGNQQGRTQVVSVPVSVLRGMLPLTTEKLDALEADLKVLQAVQLPAEAVVELKLTADQKKSLAELGKQSQEKAREAMQSGDRDAAMAVREATATKVDTILTADQKKVVAKYPNRQGGGRGGNGGGRGNREAQPPVK